MVNIVNFYSNTSDGGIFNKGIYVGMIKLVVSIFSTFYEGDLTKVFTLT